MSKVIKLDECYSISTEKDCVMLKYRCETEEMNEKTGKFIIRKNHWYYSNISQALKRFLEESLAECDDVKSMLVRIDEVDKLIDSKF